MKEQLTDDDLDSPNIRILECPVCANPVFWHDQAWHCELCNYPNEN